MIRASDHSAGICVFFLRKSAGMALQGLIKKLGTTYVAFFWKSPPQSPQPQNRSIKKFTWKSMLPAPGWMKCFIWTRKKVFEKKLFKNAEFCQPFSVCEIFAVFEVSLPGYEAVKSQKLAEMSPFSCLKRWHLSWTEMQLAKNIGK